MHIDILKLVTYRLVLLCMAKILMLDWYAVITPVLMACACRVKDDIILQWSGRGCRFVNAITTVIIIKYSGYYAV